MNDKLKTFGTVSVIMGAVALGGAIEGAPAKTCQEDQACFQWSTMGNLQRGVFIGGYDSPKDRPKRIIVDPCKFAYLEHNGRINWNATKRLKGDTFARRYGCDPRKYAFIPS